MATPTSHPSNDDLADLLQDALDRIRKLEGMQNDEPPKNTKQQVWLPVVTELSGG